MNRALIATAFNYAKTAAVVVVIVWGLATINRFGNSIDQFSEELTGMKDQYVGLQLANADLIKALRVMQENNSELHTIVSLLDGQVGELKTNIEEQGTLIYESQQKTNEVINGLVKFLMKTNPEHKAELQSFIK